jgi:hypothetical protein
LVALCLVAVSAPVWAQADEAAYRKVSRARDEARKFRSENLIEAFDKASTRFLDRYERSGRSSTVWLWRGDLLKETRPRLALEAYRRSSEPDAARRAEALAFLHARPPPLEVDRWVGDAVDISESRGQVTLVVFFSYAHPQTRGVLGWMDTKHRRWAQRGLRVVGVASVVDDPARQRPDVLAEAVAKYVLPFPVAIDRQRPRPPLSASLSLFQGRRVPWAVIIDRCGRIRALRDLRLKGNAEVEISQLLQRLLGQPSLANLEQQLLSGGDPAKRALAKLKTIRNRATADVLFRAHASLKSEDLKKETRETLEGLLPEGFLKVDFKDAQKRWDEVREKMRYSLADDRLALPS